MDVKTRWSGYGRVFLVLGLLSLLSSPYTYVVSGSVWPAGAKAAIGVALLLAFALMRARSGSPSLNRKSIWFFVSNALLVTAVFSALFAVNYVAAKKNKSWDLTRNKIFTLAPQTVSALHALTGKVRVEGFLLPASPAYEDTELLLARYQAEAPGRFTYDFKDPRKTPELIARYSLREGEATLILLRGAGATESHTALHLSAGQPLAEQELTNALAKLALTSEQKVYFLQGHGEWPLPVDGADRPSVTGLAKSLLQEGYQPSELNLLAEQKGEVPRDAALVLIAGARHPVTEPEEKALGHYLFEGGRLAVFLDAEVDGGLKALLASYGVEADPGVLADDHAAATNPYVLLTHFYSDAELGRILKRFNLIAQLPTARGLTVLHEGLLTGVHAEPVLLTSPHAWEQRALTSEPQRQDADKAGSIPVLTASSRDTKGAPQGRFDEARLLVFGTSQLLMDANWALAPNRDLVLNALAWATNQVGKVTIRPVDRDLSTLDISEPALQRIRLLATDLLPFTLLGMGLVLWIQRRNR